MRRRRASETGGVLDALPAWDEHGGDAGGGGEEDAAQETLRWPRSSLAAVSRTSSGSAASYVSVSERRTSWGGDRRLSYTGGGFGGPGGRPRSSERERRRSSSVDLLADGLLRSRFHAHLCTQVLLACAAPAAWFAALARAAGLAAAPRSTLPLAALFALVCAAAARHKFQWCAQRGARLPKRAAAQPFLTLPTHRFCAPGC
jgi:hypothetical protein